MAKLILLRGDHHRVFDLKDGVTSIGRAPDNGLWIDDPNLSRRHCEIRKVGNRFMVRDLGSFNGTFLNNLSISEQWLKAGDRLQLGSTVGFFVPSEIEILKGAEGVIAGAGAAVAAAAAAAATSAADRGLLPGEESEGREREATSRKLRNFMALLEISKAVNSELGTGQLLDKIIDRGIELMNAQRGFLILLQDGKMVFKVARTREKQAIAEPEKQISTSVLEGVTRTGEPVITINAQNDLGQFMSIVALEVRSLLCVPLRVKDRIIGAVYVDSHVSEREFSDESLNLLQAFADQASIALENARLFDEVVESREQEKKVRRIFQKYVPTEVVKEVLNIKEGAQLVGRKVIASVLFSDIRSFTAISEHMQPEEVVQFLNDYLQRMVDIVLEEGGIVDKFIGDSVMAIFGAPLTRPDDAVRAVRCGIRMLDELEVFNKVQESRGMPGLRIGIGIHTGPLIAGNIGSDKKMEYTVIGDTVNVASRIQTLNKEFKTEFLVSEDTYRYVAPYFPGCRPMEPVAIRGRSQKLQVFEILRLRVVDRAPSDETSTTTDLGIVLGEATQAGYQTFDVEL